MLLIDRLILVCSVINWNQYKKYSYNYFIHLSYMKITGWNHFSLDVIIYYEVKLWIWTGSLIVSLLLKFYYNQFLLDNLMKWKNVWLMERLALLGPGTFFSIILRYSTLIVYRLIDDALIGIISHDPSIQQQKRNFGNMLYISTLRQYCEKWN